MYPTLNSILIYTSKIPQMVAFYCEGFGYSAHQLDGDRIVELRPPGAGATLMLHAAAKGMKQGQASVKLVFACDDVEAFCAAAKDRGVEFGPLHRADGYVFANAKDPSGNSVSVSGRFS